MLKLSLTARKNDVLILGPRQCNITGKYASCFAFMRNGKMASKTTSAHLFATEADAWHAAGRAVLEYVKTDYFPNLCEMF